MNSEYHLSSRVDIEWTGPCSCSSSIPKNSTDCTIYEVNACVCHEGVSLGGGQCKQHISIRDTREYKANLRTMRLFVYWLARSRIACVFFLSHQTKTHIRDPTCEMPLSPHPNVCLYRYIYEWIHRAPNCTEEKHLNSLGDAVVNGEVGRHLKELRRRGFPFALRFFFWLWHPTTRAAAAFVVLIQLSL